MIKNEIEYQKMAETEETLWWYRALHELVLAALLKLSKDRGLTILDAGAGTGGLLSFLKQHGYYQLRGFDISPNAINYARRKGISLELSSLQEMSQRIAPQSIDRIICNDVLYFLSQTERIDVARQFYNALTPNGYVLCNLPSGQAFRGIHDVSVGISARVNQNDIPTFFPSHLFSIHTILFWPFLLSPLIYIVRAAQRIRLRYGTKTISSDVSLPHFVINEILYRLTAFENRFFSYKPFGSSLFIVAQKRLLS